MMMNLSKFMSQLYTRTTILSSRNLLHISATPNYKNSYTSKHLKSNKITYGQNRMIQTSTFSFSKSVVINFIDRHGEKHEANATVGDTLLDVTIDNDLKFETYGVCEGTISCSTCHVILDQKTYDEMEEPLMDEMDMLDLAYGLTETSRLGCQVYVTEEMDGITVKLPKEITDARDI